ncbi:glycosyltransferase family 4 protein [Prevotella sp.]|uniref:glycosyltransferase family 4 protein n=1 Tax=Prevotella sp. TaxID=59823 RepID=UPI003DA28249
MPQKILFIMHMPPPVHGASVIGEYIHNSKIVNEAFDSIYINPSASGYVSSIGKLSLGKIFFLFSFLRKIIRTVYKENPALCYLTPSTWDWGFYRDCLTVFILKRLHVKIILHFHNKPKVGFGDKWYNKFLYRHFFNGTNYIFLDEILATTFNDYIDNKHLYLCPNGIQIANNINTEYSHDGNLKFIFLSNLINDKGVSDLLDACKILNDNDLMFHCDFVGKSGDIDSHRLIELIKNKRLEDKVSYLGPKYNDEKNIVLAQHEVLVFPTYYEGETFGLVLLEAMQMGLACISTYEGAIPHVVDDNVTGLLVEQRNTKELAAKMEYCINNRDEVKKMGQKGKEKFLKLYTKEIFEQNITNILKDCINND